MLLPRAALAPCCLGPCSSSCCAMLLLPPMLPCRGRRLRRPDQPACAALGAPGASVGGACVSPVGITTRSLADSRHSLSGIPTRSLADSRHSLSGAASRWLPLSSLSMSRRQYSFQPAAPLQDAAPAQHGRGSRDGLLSPYAFHRTRSQGSMQRSVTAITTIIPAAPHSADAARAIDALSPTLSIARSRRAPCSVL